MISKNVLCITRFNYTRRKLIGESKSQFVKYKVKTVRF